MKQYLLISKGDLKMWQAQTEAEFKPVLDGFATWIDGLKAQNLWVCGDSLSGESRKLSKNGEHFVDGPFPETKEVLTGFFLIRAENLKHATELSKGCPTLSHDRLEIFELAGDCT
jgi:hypothetical protein